MAVHAALAPSENRGALSRVSILAPAPGNYSDPDHTNMLLISDINLSEDEIRQERAR